MRRLIAIPATQTRHSKARHPIVLRAMRAMIHMPGNWERNVKAATPPMAGLHLHSIIAAPPSR